MSDKQSEVDSEGDSHKYVSDANASITKNVFKTSLSEY